VDPASEPLRTGAGPFERVSGGNVALMADSVPAGSDVAAGTYRCTSCGYGCTSCGYELEIGPTDRLPPCPSCGNDEWETLTGGDSGPDQYPN